MGGRAWCIGCVRAGGAATRCCCGDGSDGATCVSLVAGLVAVWQVWCVVAAVMRRHASHALAWIRVAADAYISTTSERAPPRVYAALHVCCLIACPPPPIIHGTHSQLYANSTHVLAWPSLARLLQPHACCSRCWGIEGVRCHGAASNSVHTRAPTPALPGPGRRSSLPRTSP